MLALIGAIALLAGGCGGKKHASTTGAATTSTSASSSTGPLSKTAYDGQMATLGKVIGTALGRLPAAANAKQATTAALKAQQEIRSLAAKLQAIKPPVAIKADHAALVKSVNELADQLTPIIAKLKKGNFKALGSVTSLTSYDDITRAVDKIESAGYSIGSA